MRFWTAHALFALSTVNAIAADGGGGGHHATISSLFAPAVNVAILLGLLVWKLKGPLAEHFTAKSNEVSNTLERASLKSKEAKMMLEGEERKLANLANELKTIQNQAENDVATFEKNLSKETEEKAVKLKTDANSKILADKKAFLDELNAELLNQVIAKTKSTIKANKEYQTKVSAKLLQGL